jgi:hypothetical protein
MLLVSVQLIPDTFLRYDRRESMVFQKPSYDVLRVILIINSDAWDQ